MDGERKKELRRQYTERRTEMGVYAFRCPAENRVYLGASHNVPGIINSIRFQLQNNSFPTNRQLLADWQRYGEQGFCLEMLEQLDYDKKDELKTDYSADLAVLKEFWRERLTAEGAAVQNIKPKDR